MIIINKIPVRLQEEPQDFNLIFDPLLDVKKLGGTMEKSSTTTIQIQIPWNMTGMKNALARH